MTKWTAALGKNIIANPIFALSASQSLTIIAESRPGNLFRDAGPRWASENPPNAGKDGFWPTAALPLHSSRWNPVTALTKNIRKALAQPSHLAGSNVTRQTPHSQNGGMVSRRRDSTQARRRARPTTAHAPGTTVFGERIHRGTGGVWMRKPAAAVLP